MKLFASALCAFLLAAAAPAQAAPRVAALTPFAASTITRLGVRPVVIGQTLGGNDHLPSPPLEGRPLAHADAPARPQPRETRDLQPEHRALQQDLAARLAFRCASSA